MDKFTRIGSLYEFYGALLSKRQQEATALYYEENCSLAEIAEEYGMKTTAIVTMEEVIEHLYNREYKGRVIIDDTIKAAIDEYYRQYGAR